MSLNQQSKKGITVFGVVIDPDCRGEIGLLLYKGCKECYVFRASLCYCAHVVKVNWRESAATQSGQDDKGHRPLRNEGMGHSFRKEPRAAGVLLRVEDTQNVEEASCEC